MQAAGLEPCLAPTVNAASREEEGRRAARRLIERGAIGQGDVDAVFAACDAMALGALEAFAAADIAVPSQVGVMGFDDLVAGRFSRPPLTTIAPDPAEAGAALAAELRLQAAPASTHALTSPLTPAPARGRLRVAYVSADFISHSVAFFMAPLLQHHDRTKFEVWCYYNRGWGDETTAQLRTCADHWVECEHLSDEALARRMRADGIDILVDLSGHTAGARLGACRCRIAVGLGARRGRCIHGAITWQYTGRSAGFGRVHYYHGALDSDRDRGDSRVHRRLARPA
jgi:hypothetical protein